jgi:23S rRNA pseudouridine1911/1915/1917 synthase
LLYHCPDIKGIGDAARPGIVHRLDRDTSGVLLVAKNEVAHRRLSQQFKFRRIQKIYLGLVYGTPSTDTGRICLPVGRDTVDRKKMSTHSVKGREAETLWRVRNRYERVTLLEIDLKTGRTHQIRVHLAAVGYPIIGDAVYGARTWRKILAGHLNFLAKSAESICISRHLLHAHRIVFIHPVSQKPLAVESPIPQDMQLFMEALSHWF